MVINKDVLLKEIMNVKRDFYRVKSYTEFMMKYQSLNNLLLLYKEITGIDLKIDIPNINGYLDSVRNVTTNSDISLYEYYYNQKEHNRLSGKVLSTFNRSGINFLKYNTDTSKINKKKALEIAYSFLDDLNPKIRDLFNNMINNGLIDINLYTTQAEKAGVTYYDFESKEYIVLKTLDKVKYLGYLMHELGHAYSYKMLENKSKKQQLNFKNTYYEMPSTFMEICFIEFLKKNHMLELDRLKLEKNYLFQMYYFFLSLNNCKNIEIVDFNALKQIHYANVYSYGYYLSLLIHEMKLKDKDTTLERLDDYLSYQGLLSKDEQLNLFDLDKDKLKNMKVLRKRIELHNNEINAYQK